MLLDLPRIEAESMVRWLEHHAVIDSTSDRALQLARQTTLVTPALVIANQQTAGRGRGTHGWWSERGGLTFSLILDAGGARATAPSFALPDNWLSAWPKFSLATALAVRAALSDYLPLSEIGIRWPNDIHVAGKKICGVLPEMVEGANDRPARLVLGIGVNVNQSFASATPELQNIGVSLSDFTGQTHDLTELLLKILAELATKLSAAARHDPQLAQQWSDCSLLNGRLVTVQQAEQQLRGPCQGIDAEGALLINVAGQVQRIFGGSVVAVESLAG